jgi:hypothetical protein
MELKETLPQESHRKKKKKKFSLMGITVFDEAISPK